MKDAGKVPDLSRMLRDGLPYLTRSEATAVQLALAVSLYAHSKSNSRHDQHHDDRVKVRVFIVYTEHIMVYVYHVFITIVLTNQ